MRHLVRPLMLQLVTSDDQSALEQRIRRLLAEINEAADEVEDLEDDKEQAKLSHLLIVGAYGLNRRLAVVRQNAVRRLRERLEWAHSDVALLLKVPLHSAARIANSKLKRDPDA